MSNMSVKSSTSDPFYAPIKGVRVDKVIFGEVMFKPGEFEALAEEHPGGQTLQVAKFSSLVASALADAVDTNKDHSISLDEYTQQIVAAGGSDGAALGQFKSLDKDSDGKISSREFEAIPMPSFEDQESLVAQIEEEIRAGKDLSKPEGMVLNASGGAKDPNQVMRYLLNKDPRYIGHLE